MFNPESLKKRILKKALISWALIIVGLIILVWMIASFLAENPTFISIFG